MPSFFDTGKSPVFVLIASTLLFLPVVIVTCPVSFVLSRLIPAPTLNCRGAGDRRYFILPSWARCRTSGLSWPGFPAVGRPHWPGLAACGPGGAPVRRRGRSTDVLGPRPREGVLPQVRPLSTSVPRARSGADVWDRLWGEPNISQCRVRPASPSVS